MLETTRTRTTRTGDKLDAFSPPGSCESLCGTLSTAPGTHLSDRSEERPTKTNHRRGRDGTGRLVTSQAHKRFSAVLENVVVL